MSDRKRIDIDFYALGPDAEGHVSIEVGHRGPARPRRPRRIRPVIEQPVAPIIEAAPIPTVPIDPQVITTEPIEAAVIPVETIVPIIEVENE